MSRGPPNDETTTSDQDHPYTKAANSESCGVHGIALAWLLSCPRRVAVIAGLSTRRHSGALLSTLSCVGRAIPTGTRQKLIIADLARYVVSCRSSTTPPST